MKNKKPLVSIVMPVYNAGNFLLEAIESLQNQTYQNWELIMVDDRSTDNSWEILKNLTKEDKRIKIYQVKKHCGVAFAANLALKKVKGDLIARMDADDISLPWRIEKQVKFLQNHPETIALGGQCELINQEGETIGKKEFPLDNAKIKKMIFWSIPLQQPTLIVNRKLLPKNFKWYEKKFNVAEEVELLFKLFQYGEVFNLPETVLLYRIHGKNTSLQNPKRTFLLTFKTRIKAISKYSYQPTISGFFLNLIQFFLIILLPNKWIFPIYSFLRGMKRVSLAVLPKPFLLQKRAQIS
ncbi:MAG TPA: glycosyltransferase [Patescibacteria group bacterium]|nr:glycosyltransferase [Patescibacteria group bacterium]